MLFFVVRVLKRGNGVMRLLSIADRLPRDDFTFFQLGKRLIVYLQQDNCFVNMFHAYPRAFSNLE